MKHCRKFKNTSEANARQLKAHKLDQAMQDLLPKLPGAIAIMGSRVACIMAYEDIFENPDAPRIR